MLTFKNIISCIVFLTVIIGVTACRKEINVKLPTYTQKLVVEASIETGQPAQVLLSFTAPYFGAADLSNPAQFFVKGAFVTVSDGVLTDTLKELELGGFPVYIGTKVFGMVGKNCSTSERRLCKCGNKQLVVIKG